MDMDLRLIPIHRSYDIMTRYNWYCLLFEGEG